MAMVNNQGGRGANSDTASQHQRLLPAATNGSLAPSIANSSMRKSVAKRYIFARKVKFIFMTYEELETKFSPIYRLFKLLWSISRFTVICNTKY